MNRRSLLGRGLAVISAGMAWRGAAASAPPEPGWTAVFDGRSLDGWNLIGDANWTLADGVVQADKGTGFLVSKASFGDFQLRAEFWVDAVANSGVFIRCSNPAEVTSANAYEVNIFEKRPDPAYATGAIVDVAKVAVVPKTADRWNIIEISAKGARFSVSVNGLRTVDGAQDARLPRGPIALQHGAGVVKFRKVLLKAV